MINTLSVDLVQQNLISQQMIFIYYLGGNKKPHASIDAEAEASPPWQQPYMSYKNMNKASALKF
jgi:hypothetical protein